MAEILLGLGRQRSVSNVIVLAEAHISRAFGAPREIAGKSRTLDFVATRDEFEGAFQRVRLSVHDSAELVASLREADGELSELFDRKEEDGCVSYTYPRDGKESADGAVAALDIFSKNLVLPEVWRFEGGGYKRDPISIELLFKATVQYKASDTHLMPGQPPVFRIDNQLRVSELMGKLSRDQIEGIIREVAPESAWKRFSDEGQCTFRFHQTGIGFARATAFTKSGAPHFTFRFLPERVPSFKDLGLDEEMMLSLAGLPGGLLIVAGGPGSGKTSTCGAVIDWINSNRQFHILCVENPIEYVQVNKKSFVSQREVGIDVQSLGEGVEGAVRQDADVIFVGEMTNLDIVRAAMNAASTGSLVIATMLSSNASGVINLIIGFFNPDEREMARSQLRDNLVCILCQKLVAKAKGGRVPAVEVLFNDLPYISHGILDGNTQAIRLGMQQSLSKSKLFEQYLHDLVKQEVITLELGRDQSPEPSMFDQIHMGTYKVPRLESH